MTEAIENLKNARTALLAFEPAKAEEYLRKFEAELVDGRLPPEAVAHCAAELSTIRELAGAACEGVAAAQRQLTEILKLSRNLDTYDKAGQKKVEQVGLGSARRF